MPNSRTQRVIFQPTTYQALQRGINQIANAVRPTLGPRPRHVAIDRILDDRMPELLDNGGVIARRIIQLGDRDADVGAMFAREMLCTLHDQVGDGTATAAVLLQSVFNQGVRYLTSGGNATRLQHYLDQGMKLILAELGRMSTPVSGPQSLAQVAQSICYDPDLARLLGEIFDIIGEYGRLEIRPGRSRQHEREYVEGMYWERGLVSREMSTDSDQLRAELENAAILISNLDIQQPQQLFPALEVALRHNLRALLIVAGNFSPAAIGFLLANKRPDRLQVIAVKTPGWGEEEQAWALNDLAILTGGRPFIKAAGDTFDHIQPDHFGHARRVWADHHNFGIIGGKGDPRALRQHIATLRATHEQSDQPVLRDKLLARLGKLLGGSATLYVGGSTELEIEQRQEVAKRTAAALRGAIMEGVLPGGGVALLACQPALQARLDESQDSDARAAYRILLKTMETPMRTIAANAGFDPSEVLAHVKLAGPGHGFDATTGQVVDMAQAGIYDATNVLKAAIYAAIASAGLALTLDVLIHRKDQPTHAVGRTPARRKRL
ncbi:MAG: chaperonin GroEL [Anaerolineae bacterium]